MNFAIIGCGVIAQTHAKALVQLKEEGCILYAVCDIVPEKADALAKQYGVEKVYYDDASVFADPQVEIVCVCVPSGYPCCARMRSKNAVHFPKTVDANGDCSTGDY